MPTIASINSTDGPMEFLDLEVQERAYVDAAVQIKLEKNKKEAQKAKKGRKR